MVKLNRTTEYGLIALRHMHQKRNRQDVSVTSAREVADRYQLPFEITAKTLQRLKDTGIILSEQGARGGYQLNAGIETFSFGRFMELMEGPQAIVACAAPVQASNPSCGCEYQKLCGMQDIMGGINERVRSFLAEIPLMELMAETQPVAIASGITVGRETLGDSSHEISNLS